MSGDQCECPRTDGYRIKRKGCPAHAAKDAAYWNGNAAADQPTPDVQTVADVLEAHQAEQLWKAGGWAGDTACSCGWRMAMWSRKDFPAVHRAHVAAVMEPLIRAREAEAWGEGYETAVADTEARSAPPGPNGPVDPQANPYRAAEHRETP